MFKKITFRMMVLAVVAMVAGTVSAQEPVWTGKVTAADYVQGGEIYAPEIDYSITYTADKHLHLVCTFSEEAVGLVPQFSFDGSIMGMTSLGDSKYEIVSTNTYEEGVTLNMFFYLAHSNPTASRADVTYVVGSDNQTADEEAPMFVNAGYAAGAAGYDSVTLTVTVSDNSGKATVEVYKEEACETLLASQNITADGVTAQEVLVEGLEPETSYTLYIKVKDAAGNYADDVKAIEVTTTEAPEITETIWYGTITATDYVDGLNAWTPVIDYSITYTTDKHLRVHCTVSDFNNNNVQVNFRGAGKFEVMNMVEGNNLEYELVSADTYEAGEELNNAFFYLAYPNAASRANFTYTVGAANEAPEADVEKPVLTNVTESDVQDKTAVLNVTVTDNSGVAIITVSGDNFEAAEYTVTADGTAQTVELEGLTPETYYDLTVGAKDIAGNVADNVISIDFTTTQEVIYEEVTVTGHVSSDKSEWDPGCQAAEYFPAFSYKVTTKGDNTLAFEVTMDDADYDYAGVARAFVGAGDFYLTCAEGAKVYTGVTTQSYERGSTVRVYFRFTPVGSADVWTLPFNVEIGEEVEAGVAGLQTGNVAIYAANGNLTVAGAEGETVRVYAVSGALVYEAVASGNETISLEKGMYIVVAGKEVKKVIL